jgi:hypothetical protein
MQVGFFAVGLGPYVDPTLVRTVAVTAERLGFSTLWAPEHVVLLERYGSKYPYSAGEFPFPLNTPQTIREAAPMSHLEIPPPPVVPVVPPPKGWQQDRQLILLY